MRPVRYSIRSATLFTFAPFVLAGAGIIGMGAVACSGSSPDNGFGSGSGSGGGGAGSSSSGGSSSSSSGGSTASSSGGGSGGGILGDGGQAPMPEASTTVTNTVYAHTDNQLYSVNPTMPMTVTMLGTMVGTSDSSTDSTITDLAVDGAGDVYVNSESVVYKCMLPASGGTVSLMKVTAISSTSRFYALAFAPVGALDPNNETLVGGDSAGNLWSINTSTGAALNLGGFGADPTTSGNIFELSGDIVFYLDANNNPTGLATIRSCPSGGSSSACGNDFLAGVDMTKLKAAYNGTAQTSLLGGIYGGSGNNLGPGTGYHDVFGLAAWNSTVFGFTRHTTTQATPMLITIDTTSGAGTMVSNAFSFTDGWSGAGVTTKVTITVPKPPPPPAQ
jgi:hypothetical protein